MRTRRVLIKAKMSGGYILGLGVGWGQSKGCDERDSIIEGDQSSILGQSNGCENSKWTRALTVIGRAWKVHRREMRRRRWGWFKEIRRRREDSRRFRELRANRLSTKFPVHFPRTEDGVNGGGIEPGRYCYGDDNLGRYCKHSWGYLGETRAGAVAVDDAGRYERYEGEIMDYYSHDNKRWR